jgi:hypothetical protein
MAPIPRSARRPVHDAIAAGHPALELRDNDREAISDVLAELLLGAIDAHHEDRLRHEEGCPMSFWYQVFLVAERMTRDPLAHLPESRAQAEAIRRGDIRTRPAEYDLRLTFPQRARAIRIAVQLNGEHLERVRYKERFLEIAREQQQMAVGDERRHWEDVGRILSVGDLEWLRKFIAEICHHEFVRAAVTA